MIANSNETLPHSNHLIEEQQDEKSHSALLNHFIMLNLIYMVHNTLFNLLQVALRHL